MTKRKMTDVALRDLVRARLTKGDAFRGKSSEEYWRRQSDLADELGGMTRAEIMECYPDYVWDVK